MDGCIGEWVDMLINIWWMDDQNKEIEGHTYVWMHARMDEWKDG